MGAQTGRHFTRLILIRHAQARSRDGIYGPDTPLSPLGLRQARRLARYAAIGRGLAALYCSPLLRARQTAEPIARKLGMDAVIDERLAEFPMEPAPLDPAAAGLLWRPEDRGREDGETIREFFERNRLLCDDLCRRHTDSAIGLVTHAGTIDAIYRWALGLSWETGWSFEVEVPNASVSEIEVWPHGRQEGGAPRMAILHRIGDTRHLGRWSSPV